MVMAKLHIICGNCGRNDMFRWVDGTGGEDLDGNEYKTVFITCENCGTVHDLEENAERDSD
jgi:uncharacterized Zn finger protein